MYDNQYCRYQIPSIHHNIICIKCKGMNTSNIPLKLCQHGQHGTCDFNMFKYSPFKKKMQKHKKISCRECVFYLYLEMMSTLDSLWEVGLVGKLCNVYNGNELLIN